MICQTSVASIHLHMFKHVCSVSEITIVWVKRDSEDCEEQSFCPLSQQQETKIQNTDPYRIYWNKRRLRISTAL